MQYMETLQHKMETWQHAPFSCTAFSPLSASFAALPADCLGSTHFQRSCLQPILWQCSSAPSLYKQHFCIQNIFQVLIPFLQLQTYVSSYGLFHPIFIAHWRYFYLLHTSNLKKEQTKNLSYGKLKMQQLNVPMMNIGQRNQETSSVVCSPSLSFPGVHLILNIRLFVGKL